MASLHILAIIPARSGSKGIPHKNVCLFKGLPLLVHSIQQALACCSRYPNMRVLVSTDSEEYRRLSLEAGAEVPFLRPVELAGDLSTDYEVFRHAVDWLWQHERYRPDIIVHLRPTYPSRNSDLIEQALDRFISLYESPKPRYSSLRTVIPVRKSPFKMYTIEEGETLKPLFPSYGEMVEPYNQCRQVLPACYLHNGCLDILQTSVLEEGSVTGGSIYPWVMDVEEDKDIDYPEDMH